MAKTPMKPDLSGQEITASVSGQDVTRNFFGGVRQPTDTVLMTLAGRWEAYRDLRRDGQVHATFQQRRLAIVSRPLVVSPGAEDARSIAAADQLRANLQAISFDRASKMMAWGIFYGMAQGECLWTLKDGKVWLERVKVRTPWRFRYSDDGELRLLTQAQPITGVAMPPLKFWTLSSGADTDDEPYGLGIAHQLYWPVMFRKHGLGFWLKALEKYGGPTAVATYQPGLPAEDVKKALQAAQAARSDGALAIPSTVEIKLLEALKGSVDQATFHRQMSAEIAKITLGQTMTTDDGSSLAQGKVHFDVREELTDADIEDLCESFQEGPAAWLTAWNFPGAATPILSRPGTEDQERAATLMKTRADAVRTLGDAGYEPDEETLPTLFPGFRKKAIVAAQASGTALPAAFAEGSMGGRTAGIGDNSRRAPSTPADAVDAFVDDLDWEPVMTPMVEAIRRHIRASATPAAAAANLDQVFAQAGDQAARELLTSATFQTRLAGLLGVPLSAAEAKVMDKT